VILFYSKSFLDIYEIYTYYIVSKLKDTDVEKKFSSNVLATVTKNGSEKLKVTK